MSPLSGLKENAEEIERLRREREADERQGGKPGTMNRLIRDQAFDKNSELAERLFGNRTKQD